MLNITRAENLLILEIIEKSTSYLRIIEGHEIRAYELAGEDFQIKLREYLEEYTTNEELEVANSSSSSSGIKKLDVIEYFGNSEGRFGMATQRQEKIKRRIMSLLGIDVAGTNGGSGNNPRGYTRIEHG